MNLNFSDICDECEEWAALQPLLFETGECRYLCFECAEEVDPETKNKREWNLNPEHIEDVVNSISNNNTP